MRRLSPEEERFLQRLKEAETKKSELRVANERLFDDSDDENEVEINAEFAEEAASNPKLISVLNNEWRLVELDTWKENKLEIQKRIAIRSVLRHFEKIENFREFREDRVVAPDWAIDLFLKRKNGSISEEENAQLSEYLFWLFSSEDSAVSVFLEIPDVYDAVLAELDFTLEDTDSPEVARERLINFLIARSSVASSAAASHSIESRPADQIRLTGPRLVGNPVVAVTSAQQHSENRTQPLFPDLLCGF